MLDDTIFAAASPPGPAERAVLRCSGPRARELAATVFTPALPPVRAQIDGAVRVLDRAVEAMALVMPGPRSFTGEDVVELHVPGSPLLVGLLLAEFAAHGRELGARAALPGEFSRRAFGNGRLDLLQAEAVLQLIHAEDRAALAAAGRQLHGELSAAVTALRQQLQSALALLEAGLDFGDGETGAVATVSWLPTLRAAAETCQQIAASVPLGRVGGEVVLLGSANAGKSSLCNALAGRPAVLVASTPGTTRDVVTVELEPGVVLLDTPGDLDAPGADDRAALQLRDRLAGAAAAAVLVVDPSAPRLPVTELPVLAVVLTKADLGLPPPTLASAAPVLATSAHTGDGIEALRALLRRRARSGVRAAGFGRDCLHAAAAALAAATAAAAAGAGAELVAVDVQAALQSLTAVDGSHSPEDLLDRIFARFCLGK